MYKNAIHLFRHYGLGFPQMPLKIKLRCLHLISKIIITTILAQTKNANLFNHSSHCCILQKANPFNVNPQHHLLPKTIYILWKNLLQVEIEFLFFHSWGTDLSIYSRQCATIWDCILNTIQTKLMKFKR